MKIPQLRRNGRSLNYAKLTDSEVQNLQFRQRIIAKKRAAVAELQAELAMLQDADNAYKREVIDKYKLRKSSKGFVFSFEHGYVHRPNCKPWDDRPVPIEQADEQSSTPAEEHSPIPTDEGGAEPQEEVKEEA